MVLAEVINFPLYPDLLQFLWLEQRCPNGDIRISIAAKSDEKPVCLKYKQVYHGTAPIHESPMEHIFINKF